MNLEDIAESILKNKPLVDEVLPPDENGLFAATQALGILDTETQTVLEELLLNARHNVKGLGLVALRWSVS